MSSIKNPYQGFLSTLLGQCLIVSIFLLPVNVRFAFGGQNERIVDANSKYPLPIEVAPMNADEMISLLDSKGIKSIEYSFDSNRIYVSAKEEEEAFITLAEAGWLKDLSSQEFIATLDRWSSENSECLSDDEMALIRANEVTRLIENLSAVKQAEIMYFNDVNRKNSVRNATTVHVRTRSAKSFSEHDAEIVITLVVAARPGLDPRDVIIKDQCGNRFPIMVVHENDWYPLPVEMASGDARIIRDRFELKGITSAEYDNDSKRILVKADEEKKAIVTLAKEGYIKNISSQDFIATLDRWSSLYCRHFENRLSMRV